MECSRRDVGFLAGFGLGAVAAWLAGGSEAGVAAGGRLRPPGARSETEFLASCIRCSLCAQACPYDTLHLAGTEAGLANGTPEFTAREHPCHLCADYEAMRCIAACPTGALQVTARTEVAIGTARIDAERCLAFTGVTCRACWHACPYPNAALRYNERLQPEVDPKQCVGCGLCEHACLTDVASIVVGPRAVEVG